MDFRKLIATYDNTDTLFYLDPHYEIKGGFTELEHRDLARILQGKFIVSYNECGFIKSPYKYSHIIETKEGTYSLNVLSTKRARELLIMNFKP